MNDIVIVMMFYSNKSENQIRNKFTPKIARLLSLYAPTLRADFRNIRFTPKIKVNKIGQNSWQLYPKIVVQADTDKTKDEISIIINDWLRDAKTELTSFANEEGFTNIKWHIHFSDGVEE